MEVNKMGMKFKAKAIVLSCESKTSEKGMYFITTLGGMGWGHKFFTKQFMEPSAKEKEFDFEFDNGKLNIIQGE